MVQPENRSAASKAYKEGKVAGAENDVAKKKKKAKKFKDDASAAKKEFNKKGTSPERKSKLSKRANQSGYAADKYKSKADDAQKKLNKIYGFKTAK